MKFVESDQEDSHVATAIDTSKFDTMVDIMARIAERHRGQQESSFSEAHYYDLMSGYYRRMQTAHQEGRLLVGHSTMMPVEIFQAMEVVPMQVATTTTAIVATLKVQEELLESARAIGWRSNICSSHRVETAMILQRCLPQPDAVVWGSNVCDPNSKSGQLMQEVYGVPGFFVDRPYRARESDRRYYAQELEEAVKFLERIAGRRMDMLRFRRVLDNSLQMARLNREVSDLRGSVPCPTSNRAGTLAHVITMVFSGTEEGVAYLQGLRDSLMASVRNRTGFAHQEKHRLIQLFPPPAHAMKLMDWMEREQGAVVVSEPFNSCWGKWEIDPDDLFGSLAAKCFAMANSRQLHGPAHDAAIPDAVKEALKYKATGAIYWANVTCPHSLGLIRLMKDALWQKAGIPTLVLYIDMIDPSEMSNEETKAQIEDFLQNLPAGKS